MRMAGVDLKDLVAGDCFVIFDLHRKEPDIVYQVISPDTVRVDLDADKVGYIPVVNWKTGTALLFKPDLGVIKCSVEVQIRPMGFHWEGMQD